MAKAKAKAKATPLSKKQKLLKAKTSHKKAMAKKYGR